MFLRNSVYENGSEMMEDVPVSKGFEDNFCWYI